MIAIAYRRWSFTRGSNCKALTGKIFVFFDGRSLIGGGRIREVVAHGGSTVVGVRIYNYFRVDLAAFVHPRYRSAGGFIVWRTFLNLSKIMHRLAFSRSRHFVSLLSFSCVDIVARRLGVSWK